MKKLLLYPRYLLPALVCYLPSVGVANTLAAYRPLVVGRAAAAQPVPGHVTGHVTDEKGGGLPGVTVLVKGTQIGTSTNSNGEFTLDAPAGATLIFSSIGYVTKEVAVSGDTQLNVSLAADVQQLSEAVVVGYLTQERQNVTGAVATVGGTDVRRAPVATLSESIQGRLAGVQVTTNGTPGQTPNINIRGIGSLK